MVDAPMKSYKPSTSMSKTKAKPKTKKAGRGKTNSRKKIRQKGY